MTGQPHPTVLDPGDLILSIDLASFGVDAETTFAVADMIDSGSYRLELLDGTLAALALSSVQVTAAQQATEGIQIYIGGSAVPESTSAGLMLAAVLLALAKLLLEDR